MKILALDTSTSLASIALTSESAVMAESTFICQRSLSSRLVQEIDRLLTLSESSLNEIDLFAVALGPGSFTGVRCGVATVQGLALASGKPCAGFSTLAALAMNFSYSASPVCSLLDARKNEVYAALYDCSSGFPSPLMTESVLSAEQCVQQVCDCTSAPVIMTGEGSVRYREAISTLMGERARFAHASHNPVRAAAGALLAYANFEQHGATELSSLLPHYIRPSDAEIARIAKLNQNK